MEQIEPKSFVESERARQMMRRQGVRKTCAGLGIFAVTFVILSAKESVFDCSRLGRESMTMKNYFVQIRQDERANDLVHRQTILVTREASAAAQPSQTGKYAFVSSGVVSIPESELGFRKSFLVRDPDGHVLQLVER